MIGSKIFGKSIIVQLQIYPTNLSAVILYVSIWAMLKIAKKIEAGGQKCCLSVFPASASYWPTLWKKLHFPPKVNIYSPISPTKTGV